VLPFGNETEFEIKHLAAQLQLHDIYSQVLDLSGKQQRSSELREVLEA